jgi:hypothetical protein
MFNDGLKLRRMATYLVNKKTQYSLNVVNNTGAQNLITLIAKFSKTARTRNLLTKVKFNIENLKIYMLNFKKNLLLSKGPYLQLLALRMQLVTFQTKIPE